MRDGHPSHLAASNGIGWTERLFEAASLSTGGAIAAVLEAYTTGSNAGSLSSGLHHARGDHGSGYCTFNGLAIASFRARAAGAARVMILDLDAHCGGGTESIIRGHDGIEQVDVSVVRYDTYLPTAQARQRMAGADDYLTVIEEELDGIRDPKSISVLLYNAGMDPHERSNGPAGITTVDVDNDGFYDLFIPDGVESKLFRNTGDGRFTDITAKVGLSGLDGVSVGVFADYDNDGRPDLFISRLRSYALYRNRGDGTFEDATQAAGLAFQLQQKRAQRNAAHF